jgi:hypothetical protein
LIVVVAGTAIAPVYTVPVVEVGVEPSVVYRMPAPAVVVDSVTLWALAYVPAAGLNVGGETVGGGIGASPHPQIVVAITSRTRADEIRRFNMVIPPSFRSLWG